VARRRLGVALVLDRPVADEVDGLRRAVGDPTLGSVPAHLTLVSPVNVRADDLPAALALLRAAAGTVRGPLRLGLGPPVTFLPVNPVAYLPVAGDLDGLGRLHDALGAPPLLRAGRSLWAWVPHVTLLDGSDPGELDRLVGTLGHYSALVTLDRVVLLEQRRDPPGADGEPARGPRRWWELADAAFGPPGVVGRGGLELRLTRGRVVGPDLAAVVAEAAQVAGAPAAGPEAAAGLGGGLGLGRGGPVGVGLGGGWAGGWAPIVVSAEREGACVGGAAAWWDGQRPTVAVVVAPAARQTGVGAALLASLESAAREQGWRAPVLYGLGPPGFYRRCSAWTIPGGRAVE
jgi:GNAT superfamily N-acetyltransferase